MKLVVAPRARSDLRQIFTHLSTRNPPAARHLRRAINDAATGLTRYPESGVFIRETDVGPLRRMVVAPYIVLYTFRDDAVTILRVVHGARDFKRLIDTLRPRSS